jgi:hypothetical protein
MEPFGALPTDALEAKLLENMVGPWGLEPQTSTVSMKPVFLSIPTNL